MMVDSRLAVVARDRKLALVRLELVIEALAAVGGSAGDEIASVWGKSAADLRDRIGDSRLEEWINAAECIVQTGVHHRYPEVHVSRLARALVRIATSSGQQKIDRISIVARAIESLPAADRVFVETIFSEATYNVHAAPWVAGLLCYGDDIDCDLLLSAAHADLERREMRIRALLGLSNNTNGKEIVLDLGYGLRLCKTRYGNRERVEDWSAIDALAAMSDAQVLRLRPDINSEVEADMYLAAICAYRLGDFQICVKALLCCVDCDDDVEEYWHLLAFAHRHLTHRDVFDRIVFGRERNFMKAR